MWSPLYWYYEIRGSSTYKDQLSTDFVLNVLRETGVLQHKERQTFSNAENLPWISVSAINSSDGNYGRFEDFNSEVVTLIEIIGSKRDPSYEKIYVGLLMDIAEKLNWELIEEGGGDDGEDLVLRAIM